MSVDPTHLRAELLRRIEEVRRLAEKGPPLDTIRLSEALAQAVEGMRREEDPIPRPPFPSHRAGGVRAIRIAKTIAASLLRPLDRFLFQRQAEFNRQATAAVARLADEVRLLAERVGPIGDRFEYWHEDVRRAREERVVLLDAIERVAAEVEALRARAQGGSGADG